MSGTKIGGVLFSLQVARLVLREPYELIRMEGYLVGIELEQLLGTTVLERGGDLGHGVEEPFWESTDRGAGDLHVVWLPDTMMREAGSKSVQGERSVDEGEASYRVLVGNAEADLMEQVAMPLP